ECGERHLTGTTLRTQRGAVHRARSSGTGPRRRLQPPYLGRPYGTEHIRTARHTGPGTASPTVTDGDRQGTLTVRTHPRCSPPQPPCGVATMSRANPDEEAPDVRSRAIRSTNIRPSRQAGGALRRGVRACRP